MSPRTKKRGGSRTIILGWPSSGWGVVWGLPGGSGVWEVWNTSSQRVGKGPGVFPWRKYSKLSALNRVITLSEDFNWRFMITFGRLCYLIEIYSITYTHCNITIGPTKSYSYYFLYNTSPKSS